MGFRIQSRSPNPKPEFRGRIEPWAVKGLGVQGLGVGGLGFRNWGFRLEVSGFVQ